MEFVLGAIAFTIIGGLSYLGPNKPYNVQKLLAMDEHKDCNHYERDHKVPIRIYIASEVERILNEHKSYDRGRRGRRCHPAHDIHT